MDLRAYLVFAYVAVGLTVSLAITRHASLFATLRYLTVEKTPLLVFANAGAATILLILQSILSTTVGHLRDLELEQVIEYGKSTILDTVLFLILASPTVHGGDVPHGILFGCLGGVVCLKLFHHIAQIRVAHLLEAGLIDDKALSKMTLLLFLLLGADLAVNIFCFGHASAASSFYVWILFESMGLTLSATTGLCKLSVLFVDYSLEASSESGHGWPWKNEFIFSLDVLHDIGTLSCFLTFLLLFLFTHPARLPIYLASDVAQTARQLLFKIQSFRRYRKLATRLESDFPNATLEELDEADTCIICRDLLTIGAKKLICNHVLHFECLKGWFVHHQSCPTCRMEIPIVTKKTDQSPPPPRPTRAPTSAEPRYADEVEIVPASVLKGTAHVDSEIWKSTYSNLQEAQRLVKQASKELAELAKLHDSISSRI